MHGAKIKIVPNLYSSATGARTPAETLFIITKVFQSLFLLLHENYRHLFSAYTLYVFRDVRKTTKFKQDKKNNGGLNQATPKVRFRNITPLFSNLTTSVLCL